MTRREPRHDGETVRAAEPDNAEHASPRRDRARDLIDSAIGLAAFALSDDENF